MTSFDSVCTSPLSSFAEKHLYAIHCLDDQSCGRAEGEPRGGSAKRMANYPAHKARNRRRARHTAAVPGLGTRTEMQHHPQPSASLASGRVQSASHRSVRVSIIEQTPPPSFCGTRRRLFLSQRVQQQHCNRHSSRSIVSPAGRPMNNANLEQSVKRTFSFCRPPEGYTKMATPRFMTVTARTIRCHLNSYFTASSIHQVLVEMFCTEHGQQPHTQLQFNRHYLTSCRPARNILSIFGLSLRSVLRAGNSVWR